MSWIRTQVSIAASRELRADLRRLAPIILGMAVAVAAFVWLSRLNAQVPINEDGVRDQLLARDCAELGRCHLTGPQTSLSGFYQGAAWLDLLVAVRMLGGDTSTDRRVVMALLALSVATVFVVVWRWLRPSCALPAAVCMVAALSLDQYPSLLTNPCASAFVDVLTAAGILCYGLSAKRRFLVLAAFAWGVAINVHLGSVSLAPALLVIPILVRPRPWGDLLTAALASWIVIVATSRAAFAVNVVALSNRGALVPALVAGVLLMILAKAAGAPFRRLSWYARAWTIGFGLVVPFGLASLWLVRAAQHHFEVMYLHPILGPGATLVAAMLCVPFELTARWLRVLRWLPSVAALALVSSYVSSPSPPYPQLWALQDAQALMTHAERRGYTFRDLVFHLQGPSCWELLIGMSIYAAPPTNLASHADRRRQLRVTRLPDDGRPRSAAATLVPLSDGTVAALRDIESWMDTDRLIACRTPTDGRGEVCAGTTKRGAEGTAPERVLISLYSDTGIHGLDVPPPYIARYTIPLVPTAGESRELRLERNDNVHDSAAPDCGWQITRVDGVEIDGPLPARHVRLHSESGAPGVLVIEKPFGTILCQGNGDIDRGYPPCLFESSDDSPSDGSPEGAA